MVTVLDASGQMRDHWWWRPGWRVGRRMYTWHATFEGQSALHECAERYQSALSPLPGLDIIPLRWLHLTIQGVGFIDEVDRQDVERIVAAVRDRLRRHRPVTFEVQSPIVDPEAIMFRVRPADALQQIRDDIRAGIADVWGADRVPDSPEWAPHISIAYSNTPGPAEPYVNAVTSIAPEPVAVTLREVQLIRLDRDIRLYMWETEAMAPLGKV
jgi:2'-5' RNA ligase